MNFQNKWTPETIYTITTIGYDKDSCDMRSRCVGWFRDFFDADDAVRRNSCDINELNYYQYAVIEQNTEGIYGWTNSLASWWYHWDEENERYDVCDKPSFAEHTGGWGIG